MGDYKRVTRVRKFHYSEDTNGQVLRRISKQYKKRINLTARRKEKNDQDYSFEYRMSYPRFEGGNDAVLEYVRPGRTTKVERFLYYANSAVNDRYSPFAMLGGRRGQYTLIPAEPKFSHFRTTRKREVNMGTLRENDTEYKLLERVTQDILSQDERGLIRMYTYYEPCLSCDYVMIQFINMYPNIKIDVYYEEDYKPEEKGLI